MKDRKRKDLTTIWRLEEASKKIHRGFALITASIVENLSGDLDKALIKLRSRRPEMTREDISLLARLGQKIKAGQELTEDEDKALRVASKSRLGRVRNQRNQ